MSDFINIERENGALIVQLNRVRAINALTPDMIGAIDRALSLAEDDASIGLVLLEGLGEKGFCAGGDVRLVRSLLLDGQQDKAFAFFAAEYDLNKRIATFSKPIVSLMHGFIMGGGIGLGSHAQFRFATQSSKWAMPEGAIGFYCDVGVRLLLAKVQPHRAKMFMLRGDPHSAIAAQDLNLFDHMIGDQDFGAVRQEILRLGEGANVAAGLEHVAKKYEILEQNAQFLADSYQDWFAQPTEKLFSDLCDAKHLAQVFADKAAGKETAKLIGSRCPTTHAVSLSTLEAVSANSDVDVVFAQELALARFMARRSDFVEGVRAVLVDKDHAPNWISFSDGIEQSQILEEIRALVTLETR